MPALVVGCALPTSSGQAAPLRMRAPDGFRFGTLPVAGGTLDLAAAMRRAKAVAAR